MGTTPTPQTTDFTRDVIGRYVCNGLDEALRSTDRWARPDAKPFDIVVIGAGAVGGAVAQHLFAQDRTHSHRILVLEAGPYLLPEHLQNLPMPGLQIYGPEATSIADLRSQGRFGLDQPRDEVWGLPWHSNTKSPGLAFVIGGRSLAWGGWSPKWLREELPVDGPSPWPSEFVEAMFDGYLDETAEQLGTSETNDFIHGALHDSLRARLAAAVDAGSISGAMPLDELPPHLADEAAKADRELRLEAPLAVQTATRAGFFPLNKFSSVPLLMKAARDAYTESGGDDVKKRLMVVPNCHVKRLTTTGFSGTRAVTGIDTNLGYIPLADDGHVILAMGTIENARTALVSFAGTANHPIMGRNLGAHLISFHSIRIPRDALDIDPEINELQTSALLLKGRHTYEDGGSAHWHLQITGTGLGPWEFYSEAELYQKIPDIDTLERFRFADDTHVVLTLIGIGEMRPQNPANRVTLDPEVDEFGAQRAFVHLEASPDDVALWDAMDLAADDTAAALAGGGPYEILTWTDLIPVGPGDDPAELFPYWARRHELGSSHHEVGPLWMGRDPDSSITDSDGRFHHVVNAHVAGPAAWPTGGGSAGPVLTGIAQGRRLADGLVPDPTPYDPGEGWEPLFDGMSPHGWQMAGAGGFAVVDGGLESIPGDDLGLFWFGQPTPRNFVLALQFRRFRREDNSGVFVRFPDPRSKGYFNEAYVAVHFGFEVQIDDHAAGTVYGTASGPTAVGQRALGQWNDLEITVRDQLYTVELNGQQTARFQNTDPERGLPSTPADPSFVGLQSYPGSRVGFRNLRLRRLTRA